MRYNVLLATAVAVALILAGLGVALSTPDRSALRAVVAAVPIAGAYVAPLVPDAPGARPATAPAAEPCTTVGR